MYKKKFVSLTLGGMLALSLFFSFWAVALQAHAASSGQSIPRAVTNPYGDPYLGSMFDGKNSQCLDCRKARRMGCQKWNHSWYRYCQGMDLL